LPSGFSTTSARHQRRAPKSQAEKKAFSKVCEERGLIFDRLRRAIYLI
jgi:hypothetical protein